MLLLTSWKVHGALTRSLATHRARHLFLRAKVIEEASGKKAPRIKKVLLALYSDIEYTFTVEGPASSERADQRAAGPARHSRVTGNWEGNPG